MEAENAFIGKSDKPSEKELDAALGPSREIWDQLIAELTSEHGVDLQEWKSYSPKYGWHLQLRKAKRNIVYLGPCNGCFRVSMILGDRAIAAARAGKLSKSALKLISEAPRYPEGTGVHFPVKRAADLALVRKLVLAKLQN